MAATSTRERLVAPCPEHAVPSDSDLATALAVASTCGRCLVTDPVTGEWVTCPSNAAPH